jgi:myo-inositol-1(or 4)-monophosphatase
MNLSKKDLASLCEIAVQAAEKAGALIREYSQKEFIIKRKQGGTSEASQVVTEVDLLSQEIILKIIKPTLTQYDLALLTEESSDDHSRLEKDHFWCIDPLDGTLPFTESKPGYSVSIALVSQAGVPQLGIVYDPVKQNLYQAIRGEGVYKNGEPFIIDPPSEIAELTIINDRSILKDPRAEKCFEDLNVMAAKLGFSDTKTIQYGGAVMNACWVLENAPAIYFKLKQSKLGGGSLWDFAATVCLYNELDTACCDLTGKPLDLNRQASTFMNHHGVLYASDEHLANAALKVFAPLSKA